MAIKIYKKSSTIKNEIIFIFLSVFYLHVVDSFRIGQSALEFPNLLELVKDHKFLTVLTLITVFSISRVKSFSTYLLVIFTGVIFVNCFTLYFTNFNKITLMFSFIYAFFSFYFIFTWSRELKNSIYSPGYRKTQLDKRPFFNIPLTLVDGKNNLQEGVLTNWDLDSCFIYLENKNRDLKKRIQLAIKFEGQEFRESGEIVTSFGKNGLGVKFSGGKSEAKFPGWDDFFKILKDRGF